MPRPQKEGLEYFPLDVDMDNDDKIVLIEAKHGILGFGLIIKLYMKVYREGYYYKWNEKEQLLFSKRVNVDINKITEIVNDAIKWGLFDEEMLSKHSILTSCGIQKRYVKAAQRRQKIKIAKEHLLLSNDFLNDFDNVVIVSINNDNDNENTHSEGVNVNIGTQSKVKYSKESTYALFEHLWQLYPRKKGKGQVSDTQKEKLNKIGQEHLERCIKRFVEEMEAEGRPIEKYPYGSTFFNSGYIDYLDENYAPQQQAKGPSRKVIHG